jgi:translation elongation factor P/translation initiation factor 5A
MECKNLFVGARVTIPVPQEDDTWETAMVADVEDILDDDMVVFMDDEYSPHEIEASRLQLYKG